MPFKSYESVLIETTDHIASASERVIKEFKDDQKVGCSTPSHRLIKALDGLEDAVKKYRDTFGKYSRPLIF